MELLGAVDPYASAVAVISIENQAGKDFAIDAEEAYGLLKRIPILEDAPLGMKVKIGKYRARSASATGSTCMISPDDPAPRRGALSRDGARGLFRIRIQPTGMDMNFYVPNPIPQRRWK